MVSLTFLGWRKQLFSAESHISPSISVQFSHSVMSDSLRPHELQHTRPPCPSLTPGIYSNPCPSSWWCHPAISSSIVPFSYCPQSLLASRSFQMSQLFAWGGQSTGVSASASVSTLYIKGLLQHYPSTSKKWKITHHILEFPQYRSTLNRTNSATQFNTCWLLAFYALDILAGTEVIPITKTQFMLSKSEEDRQFQH